MCVSNISVRIWTHVWISEEHQSALVMRLLNKTTLRYNKIVIEFIRNVIRYQQRGLTPQTCGLSLVDLQAACMLVKQVLKSVRA